jgi:hypothetical protein
VAESDSFLFSRILLKSRQRITSQNQEKLLFSTSNSLVHFCYGPGEGYATESVARPAVQIVMRSVAGED